MTYISKELENPVQLALLHRCLVHLHNQTAQLGKCIFWCPRCKLSQALNKVHVGTLGPPLLYKYTAPKLCRVYKYNLLKCMLEKRSTLINKVTRYTHMYMYMYIVHEQDMEVYVCTSTYTCTVAHYLYMWKIHDLVWRTISCTRLYTLYFVYACTHVHVHTVDIDCAQHVNMTDSTHVHTCYCHVWSFMYISSTYTSTAMYRSVNQTI